MNNNLKDEQLTHYIHEIIMHCFGTEKSFDEFNKLINHPEYKQTRYVWFALNSFLSHSAMVSKYLYPPNKLNFERGIKLREILELVESSELISREARNNIEHFDERIDNWARLDTNCILEIVLENRKAYEFIKGKKKRIKRLLLKEELIFISENKNSSQLELELNPVHKELLKINKKAIEWLEKFSPYSFIYP